MVLQKQFDHGFNGSQAPTTPRATRSARRRAKFQRRVEDNQMCAFDLLATAAGKLLQEKENPAMSSDTLSEKDQDGFVKECQDANTPFKRELSDERSCDKRCSFDLTPQTHNQNCCLNELPHPEIDGHSGNASMVTSSSCSERYVAEKWVDGKSHDKAENFISKVQLDSSGCPEVSFCMLDGDTSKVKDKLHKFEKVPVGTGTEMCSFEDQLDEKPPAPISPGSNAKLSEHNDKIPSSSLSKGFDNVPVVNRDDDENFSGCTQPSNKRNSSRPMTCIGDRRIRKILASKYWKVAQDSKDDILSNSDGNLRPIYDNKKSCYKRQRCQMNIPFKKRKLFNGCSISNSKGFIKNGGIYYSPKNGMSQDDSGLSLGMWKDPAISSSEACQHSALQSRGSHVKLRIKSFRVPELFIEIPETATIGSLKRTVMEAVTAVLGGGLHVGVILHGKKVRDDSKTLLQTGISHGNQRDALGFTLEPNSSQSLPPVCAADSPHVPSPYMVQSQIRYPSSPVVIQQRILGSSDLLPEHQVTGMGNLVESDHDSAPSSINTSVDKGMIDSKAQVTVPKMDMETLAMVPVLQKSKRSEIVQRRIRRPFSIDEVEALVQAVEILGTGRWRDVKLHAFDNAKHRTYVDLKDKWKTLVHTARISPQQRRGEPVPQQLLDRVLTAQAYWSQQQTKQQNKQHREACLLFK